MSVLLYGCTAWILPKCQEKKLDWNYSRMLHIFFKQILETAPYKTASVQPLSSILKTIQIRRRRYVGHCWRSKDKLINNVLLWSTIRVDGMTWWWWSSIHGHTRTKIHQLCLNTGCHLENLPRVMTKKDGWQERIKGICTVDTSWWWWWWWWRNWY